MKAWKHYSMATELKLEDVAKPEPQAGEVLLKVEATGLCHSDLHILKGSSASTAATDEYISGHEVAGRAVQNGEGANAKIDQLYAVLGVNACMKCEECAEGCHEICSGNKKNIGLGRDGGFAEFLAVPESSLVAVPAGISAEVAAVAADAVVTPYHALKTRGGLTAGSNIAIIGLGGLGMNAVEIALMLGAHVWATDIKEDALVAARKLGATALSMDDLRQTAKATKFHFVLDAVGLSQTFEAAQEMVGKNGKIILMGLGAKSLNFLSGVCIIKEVTVTVSLWGNKKDLEAVLEHIAAGRLQPQVKTAPLVELSHYISEMQKGRLSTRMAFVP